MEKEIYIYVRELGTNREVRRFPWKPTSAHNLEKCVSGLLRNMNRERYCVDDDEPWAYIREHEKSNNHSRK